MEFIDLNIVQLMGVVILVFCGGYYVGTRNTEIKWLHRQIGKLESDLYPVVKARYNNDISAGSIRKNHETQEVDHTPFTTIPTIMENPRVDITAR